MRVVLYILYFTLHQFFPAVKPFSEKIGNSLAQQAFGGQDTWSLRSAQPRHPRGVCECS